MTEYMVSDPDIMSWEKNVINASVNKINNSSLELEVRFGPWDSDEKRWTKDKLSFSSYHNVLSHYGNDNFEDIITEEYVFNGFRLVKTINENGKDLLKLWYKRSLLHSRNNKIVSDQYRFKIDLASELLINDFGEIDDDILSYFTIDWLNDFDITNFKDLIVENKEIKENLTQFIEELKKVLNGEKSTLILYRSKNRKSLTLDGISRLDLTTIKSIRGSVTYEVELELIEYNEDNLKKIPSQIFKVIRILRKTDIIYSWTSYSKIISFVNKTIKKVNPILRGENQTRFDHLKLDHRFLYNARNLNINDMKYGGLVGWNPYKTKNNKTKNNKINKLPDWKLNFDPKNVDNRKIAKYLGTSTENAESIADARSQFFDYSVAHKADGYRKLLVIHSSGIWLISGPDNASLVISGERMDTEKIRISYLPRASDKVKQILRSLSGFIYEGELIPTENRKIENNNLINDFWYYDVLSIPATGSTSKSVDSRYGNSSIQNLPYIDRLSKGINLAETVTSIFSVLNPVPISIRAKTIKRFNSVTSFYDIMNTMMIESQSQPFETDGFIFTCTNMPYNSSNKTLKLYKRNLMDYGDICKWKPSTFLSVDLSIKFKGSSKSGLYSYGGGNKYARFEGSFVFL